MSKTAKPVENLLHIQEGLDLFMKDGLKDSIFYSSIFNTMRILKKVNQGDTYLENYLGMLKKYGPFLDVYHVLQAIGSRFSPATVLEIGTRTGISLCQLLSGYVHQEKLQRVVCVDPFDAWTSPGLVRSNLRHLNLPVEKVEIRTQKSDEFFATLPEEEMFDLILVDGDHSKEAAAKDLANAHKHLKQTGFLIMDDLSENPGEFALDDVWRNFLELYKVSYVSATSLEGKGVGVAIKL
jgi:predicted O-methyltransferase YrrM